MVRKVSCTHTYTVRFKILNLNQAAQEKKDKLAALKKWAHFDGFDRESFDGIKDVMLHSLLWSDWDHQSSTDLFLSASSEDFDGIDSAKEDKDDDAHTSKKRKIAGRRENGIEGGIARRHDLREIAQMGGGGRVMFMFEKVSKSKM